MDGVQPVPQERHMHVMLVELLQLLHQAQHVPLHPAHVPAAGPAAHQLVRPSGERG